ncbi:WD-40 repeat containing protein [Thalassiosira pseudonana CCMP1335]|uniref:WD-40 repeat containing protein n=1 Tax=Thalassiosira pseudonana TaxID=35128 RepID=B5YMY9_THAPS|nr:WD-40 repeat containing protein [Thalassiosira pseudonana CCMP1335]ACI64541.1 WD-40 repeat containing protein [Thalassiosira pseudonana CCMP1335]|eukprot:g6731.t1 g6731   contig23:1109232-1110483(-)
MSFGVAAAQTPQLVGSCTAGRAASATPNDHSVAQAGNDGITSVIWSPTANNLVSTNWDGGVRCWEVQESAGQVRAMPKAQVNHENNSPVLDSCFSPDGTTVFSVGADKAVRMWQLGQTPTNNVPQQIGAHDQPIKSVAFLPSTNMIVSGGWDNMLKFWDARQPNPVGSLQMPDKVYDLDVRDSLMVVACAGRHIITYNVQGQPQEHERKESPLKFQSRCVAAFPDATGYAVGSIEGRVGIQYVTKVPGKESFAFKCHRDQSKVFPVNNICFHKQFGTFATVGGDGIINFWDKDNKQRLKGFPAIHRTITCANFSAQGNLFAYASSYDWHKGSSGYAPGTPNEIWVHSVQEEEIKPKAKKTGYR